jgi:phosphatidylglycerol---prolipoprotein diacylglyceryl transferase
MIDPVAINIGIFQIRWYGIIMAFGFIMAYFISQKLAKYRNISKEDMSDYYIYFLVSSIIGARLWAVILNYQNYITNPLEIFAVWHGGMAIHGGIAGAVIATYYFTKKRNINFYDIADIMVIPTALGLALGRIGNLINQEFYGTPTSLPWGIYFDNLPEKRHPSQIYESLKNLLIFSITLKLFLFKKLKRGTIFWIFILLYSLLRFSIEFLKDMSTFLSLTYGQIISIPLIILSIIMLKRIGNPTQHLNNN